MWRIGCRCPLPAKDIISLSFMYVKEVVALDVK